jgi:hypothetical protein
MIPTPEPRRKALKWDWLLMAPLVLIAFGILMGIVRERLHSPWWRAAVAAGAFAMLGLSIAQIRKLRG